MILLWILATIASLLIGGAFVLFAWYCSTNGGHGY